MGSFFDNTRNWGLTIAVIGVVGLAFLIVSMTDGVTSLEIVRVFTGLFYVAFGVLIAKRICPEFMTRLFPMGMESKFGCLIAHSFMVGLVTVVIGLYNIVDGIILGIIMVLLGLALMGTGHIAAMPKKTKLDKIMWPAMLAIFFILMVYEIVLFFDLQYYGLEGMIAVAGYIRVGAEILMVLIAFIYLLDPEVRTKF